APGAGLVPAEAPVDAAQLARLGKVPVDAADHRFRVPLEDAARLVLRALPSQTDIVLLGSIASAKYVDPLLGIFGERLLFPPSFRSRAPLWSAALPPASFAVGGMALVAGPLVPLGPSFPSGARVQAAAPGTARGPLRGLHPPSCGGGVLAET